MRDLLLIAAEAGGTLLQRRVSKNAVFGLNFLPGFWTHKFLAQPPPHLGSGGFHEGRKLGNKFGVILGFFGHPRCDEVLSLIRIVETIQAAYTMLVWMTPIDNAPLGPCHASVLKHTRCFSYRL